MQKYNEQVFYIKTKNPSIHTEVQINILRSVLTNYYVKNLYNNPESSKDSLVLYLAWNRLCSYLKSSLNQIKKEKGKNLHEIFQQLLSYYHFLTFDDKLQLPLFRLIECIFALPEMHSLKTPLSNYKLKTHEDLADCSYIDAATIGHIDFLHGQLVQYPVTVFTMDKPTQVLNRLQISRRLLEQLQSEVVGWNLLPSYGGEVICITKINNTLKLRERIGHCILSN